MIVFLVVVFVSIFRFSELLEGSNEFIFVCHMNITHQSEDRLFSFLIISHKMSGCLRNKN